MRWTYGQKVLTIVMNVDVHHGDQDVMDNDHYDGHDNDGGHDNDKDVWDGGGHGQGGGCGARDQERLRRGRGRQDLKRRVC